MALTGVPLLVSVLAAMAAAIAATVLLWSRFDRWRLPSRVVGVLLSEVLVVASIGLLVNGAAEFYPSWRALLGDTGTATATAHRPAGRLDARLADAGATATSLPWQPADLARWRLAAPPELVAPAGYSRPGPAAYPTVLVLTDAAPAPHATAPGPGTPPARRATDRDRDRSTTNGADAARQAIERGSGVVGVVAVASAQTTAAALATLPAALARDVRVTGHGWALIAAAAQAPLAAGLVRAEPGRFTALAVVGGPVPPDVRADPAVDSGTIGAGDPARAWTAATAWAVRHTAPALAAPLVLPAEVR